jgi:hypothetical protein
MWADRYVDKALWPKARIVLFHTTLTTLKPRKQTVRHITSPDIPNSICIPKPSIHAVDTPLGRRWRVETPIPFNGGHLRAEFRYWTAALEYALEQVRVRVEVTKRAIEEALRPPSSTG